MKKAILFGSILYFFAAASSWGQTSKAELLKDIVKVVGSKMTSNDYTLVTFSNGNSLQVKAYAEAPATGLISRDNFIALTTTIVASTIEELTKEDEGAKTKDLSAVIGNPDITIKTFVAKEGVQVEVTTSEGVNRNTIAWDDLLK